MGRYQNSGTCSMSVCLYVCLCVCGTLISKVSWCPTRQKMRVSPKFTLFVCMKLKECLNPSLRTSCMEAPLAVVMSVTRSLSQSVRNRAPLSASPSVRHSVLRPLKDVCLMINALAAVDAEGAAGFSPRRGREGESPICVRRP